MKDQVFAIIDNPINSEQLSGKGLKQVLIVVRTTESQEKTLVDLLGAIKLDIEHDIIKLTVEGNEAVTLSALLDTHKITKVVSFGFTAEELGLNINHAYYHQYTIGATGIILSETIAALNEDKNKKIALWKVLQAAFLG